MNSIAEVDFSVEAVRNALRAAFFDVGEDTIEFGPRIQAFELNQTGYASAQIAVVIEEPGEKAVRLVFRFIPLPDIGSPERAAVIANSVTSETGGTVACYVDGAFAFHLTIVIPANGEMVVRHLVDASRLLDGTARGVWEAELSQYG